MNDGRGKKLGWVKVEFRLEENEHHAGWELREWRNGGTGALVTAGTCPIGDTPAEALSSVVQAVQEAIEHLVVHLPLARSWQSR